MLSRQCLLVCVCFFFASCGKEERPEIDPELFSADVHISIAQRTLVLPFLALENYAYRQPSFSLDRTRDQEQAIKARNKMLRDSADPERPLIVDSLSVVVHTYGWKVFSSRSSDELCVRMAREWARLACGSPWAAIHQALPPNRFKLVDLRHLQAGASRGLANCLDDGKPTGPLPHRPGEAAMICRAEVFGGDPDEFHRAVVRIDGNLGALWMVWRYGHNGETAEAMAKREGEAIFTFVKYGLGANEEFQLLQNAMCRLRRPGSKESVGGPDCPDSAPPVNSSEA